MYDYELANTVKEMENAKMWVAKDGVYTSSPETTDSLPAGFYRGVELRECIGIEKVDVSLDELIDLNTKTHEVLMNDFVTFWEKEQMMRERGFSHRRGILLFGPPGSGKTSVINILAKKLIKEKNGIVLIGDTHPTLVRGALKLIRKLEPTRPMILLFEDIDAMVEKEKNGSEYLSILDGQDTESSLVVIATTNYVERLEERIKDRPGRFDRVWLVDNPSFDVRMQFIKSKGLDEEMCESWAKRTEGWSLAHLKELIIATEVLGEGVEETFERIEEMKVRKSSEDTSRGKEKLGF